MLYMGHSHCQHCLASFCIYISQYFSVHYTVDGHLGGFQSLAVMKSATMSIFMSLVHIYTPFFWICVCMEAVANA